MWLLIGSFSTTRQVIIFTDKEQEDFNVHLQFHQSETEENLKLSFHPTQDAFNFDLDQALSPWNTFRNKEVVSEFEAG